MPFEFLRNYGPTKNKPSTVNSGEILLPGKKKIILEELTYSGGGEFFDSVTVKGKGIWIGRGHVDKGNDTALIKRGGRHALLKRGETLIVNFDGLDKEVEITSVNQ